MVTLLWLIKRVCFFYSPGGAFASFCYFHLAYAEYIKYLHPSAKLQ